MDKRKMVNLQNSGSTYNSRFMDSFSQSSESNPKGSGQHQPKKPRLDIQVNLSGSVSCKTDKNGDIYDELFCDKEDMWGDDPDIAILEKVEFDETLALSQFPDTMPAKCIQTQNGFTEPQCNISKPNPSTTQLTKQVNLDKPGVRINTNVNHHSLRGTPLRRHASSGWPSSNIFSPQASNMSVTSRVVKRPNNSLHTEFDLLKIETENVKEELTRKTGEVNLLRDRIKSLQEEANKQKKDFMDRIGTLKQEAEKNITHLSRENKSLKGQLEVKNMEIETAERKAHHLNTVTRLHPESPNNRLRSNIKAVFSPIRTVNRVGLKEDKLMYGRSHIRAKNYTLSFELLKKLITPELLKPTQFEPPITESVRTSSNPSLFTGLDLRNPASSSSSNYVTAQSSVRDVVSSVTKLQLNESWPSLESCSISLLSSKLLDVSSDNAHITILQVLESCHKILQEQLHQLNSATCSQNRHVEREREVHHLGYKCMQLTCDYNLLSNREIHNNERGICARRALALLTNLVETSRFAAEQIHPRNPCLQTQNRNKDVKMETQFENDSTGTYNPSTILNTIEEIVCQIEKQRRTLMFQGLLAAVMKLVKCFLQTGIALSQICQQVIVNILRGVIFSRPGSFVVQNILQVLLAATRCPDIIDNLCKNSAKKTFLENPHHFTFSPDTCVLQVLCPLLQLVETPRKHILSDIFTCWVLTLFYGSQRSPKWLFGVPSNRSCQCRPLVSRLIFTLLGEVCYDYPSISASNFEKVLVEKLLIRGILLVSTLLYHDEHFGVNVDSESIGYFEQFLHSLNTSDFIPDIKLNKACREILESLCQQEFLRQPAHTSDMHSKHLSSFFNSITRSSNRSDILDSLEVC